MLCRCAFWTLQRDPSLWHDPEVTLCCPPVNAVHSLQQCCIQEVDSRMDHNALQAGTGGRLECAEIAVLSQVSCAACCSKF